MTKPNKEAVVIATEVLRRIVREHFKDSLLP